MPEVLRSATVQIPFPIDLPISPQVHVVGRGKEGQIVCHLYLSAAGLSIHGPGQVMLANLNWEGLVELAQRDQH